MRQLSANSHQMSVKSARLSIPQRVPAMLLKWSSMKKTQVFLIMLFLISYQCSLVKAFGEEIHSRAAVVMEASTGRVLGGKNPDLRLPPASTTKLMTAMVVLDRTALNDVVTISERAAAISPTKAHLRAGERMTVETLLYTALLKSANDAAFTLAEYTAGSEERFVEIMNQKAIALGMSNTCFINATGLPGQGQYTTAYDLAKMMRYAMRYPEIREIVNTKEFLVTTEGGRTIPIRNINKLLWSEESMLGGKTGYTRASRHCFVCAGEQENEMIIVSVLGAPSRAMLWKESGGLLEKGFAVMQSREEPVVYYTKYNYNGSVRKASYNSTNASTDKKVSKKKRHQKTAKRINGGSKSANSKSHAHKKMAKKVTTKANKPKKKSSAKTVKT
jgi:serine-type D-Ala-D-Ala carboxypeptidase (penicillin-binding protein 5/6)